MPDKVNRIQSFTVNHNTLTEGIYISRTDRGIVTYDLRTRKPNAGDYMDNITMHTFEHMFATYVRNSCISDSVLYFGP
ncbi:MAG: S-ribosylhomocysteine lyase, partial [Clostridia bacterium]|nr:S-ribosylhomocysteine lyase [Clostridia bacterium]